MKTYYLVALVVLIALAIAFFFSLGTNNWDKKTDETGDVIDEKELSEMITLNPLSETVGFPKAKLEISTITAKGDKSDSSTLMVTYKLSDFNLSETTKGEKAHEMANSPEGQHIHFILDGEPYQALYKPENSIKLKTGTEHYLLSFLSSSYHESIKNIDAIVLKHFEITNDGEYRELPTEIGPMLFYSRPKGEYKGKDTQAILLDFFLFNVALEKEGYKVKVNINDKEFIVDTWQAYEIEGLPMGESTITLTLIDKDGGDVAGKYTMINRKIELSE